MGPGLTAAGAAALVVTATVLAACAAQRAAPPAPALPQISSTTAADTGPLPPPEALTAVMDRLADPAVPGADKLALLQNAAPPDAATLDEFSAALRDGGFDPVVFRVTDLRWADQPGAVLAAVTVTTTSPANPGEFAFPMEFRAGPGGWQLTRDTAEMLLAFGNAREPGR